MPQYESYAITLTFRPHIKYVVRMARIASFRQMVRDALKHYCSYHLQYSLEYHKYPVTHPFSGQNNPQAPHVHAYLEVYNYELPQRVIDKLYKEFNKKFGRTQFDQIHTKDEQLRWVEYIQKDVITNNQLYPTIQHHKEINHNLQDYENTLNNIDNYISDNE